MRIDRHQEGPRMRQYKKRQRGKALKIAIAGAGIVAATFLTFGIYQFFSHQESPVTADDAIAVSDDKQLSEEPGEEALLTGSVSDISVDAGTGSDLSHSSTTIENSISTEEGIYYSSDEESKANIGKTDASTNISGTDDTQEYESDINELEPKPAFWDDRDFVNRIEKLSLRRKICSLIITRPQTFDDSVTENGKTTLIDDSVKQNLKSNPVCGLMMNESNIVYTTQLQNMVNELKSLGKNELPFPMFIMMYGKDRQAWEAPLRDNLEAYWENEGRYGNVDELSMPEIVTEYGFNLYCVEDLEDIDQKIHDCEKYNIQACIAFSGKKEAASESFLKELDNFQAQISDEEEMIMIPADLFNGLNTDSITNHADSSTSAQENENIIEGLRTREGLEDAVIMADTIGSNTWDESSAVSALKAGADVIITENFDDILKAIKTAVESGELAEDRIDESLYRVFKAKRRIF